MKTTLEEVVMQRESLRTALADLLATIGRHNWRVNSDERDTVREARAVLLSIPHRPLKAPDKN